MIFDKHANLKYKYGNRHFWAEGYYVSTVGLKWGNHKEIYTRVLSQLNTSFSVPTATGTSCSCCLTSSNISPRSNNTPLNASFYLPPVRLHPMGRELIREDRTWLTWPSALPLLLSFGPLNGFLMLPSSRECSMHFHQSVLLPLLFLHNLSVSQLPFENPLQF